MQKFGVSHYNPDVGRISLKLVNNLGNLSLSMMRPERYTVITAKIHINQIVEFRDMLGKNHLHIDQEDPMADLVTRSMKTVIGGQIKIEINDKPAAEIDLERDKINVNLLEPMLFRTPDDETGLFDKLNTAKEFAQRLTDNGLTLSFLRRGKNALILGKDAKPSLSKLITRSNNIQIDSIKESGKLKSDLKSD